jgi:cytochrome d ubiquinol oxidase subunit II
MGEAIDLPLIWAAILSLAVFIYVVLDGFDLGIGILFPYLQSDTQRDVAMNTVAPVWDGNETWLILGGGGLFAAFPLAYAIVMPALYAPFILMMLALVFRGVSFEYRWRDPDHRKWWDLSFHWGSVVATFMQGIVLGAFVQGIEVDGRAYGGGWWDWLTPFTIMCGFALLASYSLLGSAWLVMKTSDDIRDIAYKYSFRMALVTLGFAAVVSVWVPFQSPLVWDRWFTTPNFWYVAPIPALTLWTAGIIFSAIRRRRDYMLYPAVIMLNTLGFVGLGVGLAPYIVPHAVTIHEAAGPDVSLRFMLVGAGLLLPVILLYTGYSYYIFRGKVTAENGYH